MTRPTPETLRSRATALHEHESQLQDPSPELEAAIRSGELIDETKYDLVRETGTRRKSEPLLLTQRMRIARDEEGTRKSRITFTR